MADRARKFSRKVELEARLGRNGELTGGACTHVAEAQNLHGRFAFPTSRVGVVISREQLGVLLLTGDGAWHDWSRSQMKQVACWRSVVWQNAQ